jgi:hypothetical protein
MRLVTTGVMLLLFGTVVGPAAAAVREPEGACPTEGQTEQEPNDTSAAASPILTWGPTGTALFVGIYGTIAVPGDVDWYSFASPNPGTRLWLSVDTGVAGPGSLDSVVSVFAPDGVTLLETDDDDGTGNGRDESIESYEASVIGGLVLQAAGTYYVRVQAKDPGTTINGYSLLVSILDQAPLAEIEPNNTMNQSQLVYWKSVLGSLSSSADTDWYVVQNQLWGGPPFVVVDGDPERDGITTDVTLHVVGWNGQTITTNSAGAGSPSDPPAEGFHYNVGVYARVTGTGPGTYLLIAAVTGESCTVPVEVQSFEVE